MKFFARSARILLSVLMLLHASFSMANGPLGPAATVILNFGSSQTTPRIGLGLGIYSGESPAEARMAPLIALALGGRRIDQQSIFNNAITAASSTNSTNKNSEEDHTFLYVAGAVTIVAVGALLLTARHNAPATQGSGGSNPPAQ